MNIILAAILVLFSSHSIAGPISAGGGKGVLCRNPDKTIKYVKALDLFEGEALYGLQIRQSSKGVDSQVQDALAVIPASSRGLISTYLGIVQTGLKKQKGITLQPIDDAVIAVLPTNCEPVQLANYFNDHLILVDEDLWDQMDATNQAALLLHEAVYAAERMWGATNSQRSRHIVAGLFAVGTKWEDIKTGIPGGALQCGAQGLGFFYAFQDSSHSWLLQFQALNGNVMSKKTFSVTDDFNFNDAKTFPTLPGDTKVGESHESTGFMSSEFEDADTMTVSSRWEKLTIPSGAVYQQLRYYLTWKSATYPSTGISRASVNCTMVSRVPLF